METMEKGSLKREKMNVKEFLNFKNIAKKGNVKFDCEHKGNGDYLVECEEWFLSLIGY